jgi:integrase
VDLWLDELREKALLHPNRMTLDHELMLLSILVKSYLEEEDDLQFHFPIKERHWKASILKRKKKLSSKDFTKEEFFRFRNALNAQGRYGWFYAALATVQYFQALRISEAAALYREDVRFNDRAPAFSRLTVKRSLCWTRRKDLPTYMQIGFKNSDSFEDGVKEQPIFPETHDALQVMFQKNPDQKSGLIFAIDGVPLEYRQIQHAYDYAFKRAGLPYTGTHVLRHGGCRNLYNENGDLSVAQQLLGDKSEQATKVYARRKASALTEVAEAHWQEKVANGVEGGCKWLHEAEKNKKPERHLRVIK